MPPRCRNQSRGAKEKSGAFTGKASLSSPHPFGHTTVPAHVAAAVAQAAAPCVPGQGRRRVCSRPKASDWEGKKRRAGGQTSAYHAGCSSVLARGCLSIQPWGRGSTCSSKHKRNLASTQTRVSAAVFAANPSSSSERCPSDGRSVDRSIARVGWFGGCVCVEASDCTAAVCR